MHRVKFLPHTADIRMKVEADSLEEIFKGAFEGMRKLIKRKTGAEYNSKEYAERIDIESGDVTTLLVDFLNKVLSLSQINKIVYTDVEILNLSNNRIVADIKGCQTNSWDEDIKAVTYHEAAVLKSDNQKWETNLIFDI